MGVVYLLIGGCLILLSGSALLALFWAAKDRQFHDMNAGSRVIFDDEEPEGQPTDMVLPDTRRKKSMKDDATTREAS